MKGGRNFPLSLSFPPNFFLQYLFFIITTVGVLPTLQGSGLEGYQREIRLAPQVSLSVGGMMLLVCSLPRDEEIAAVFMYVSITIITG